MHLKYLVEDFPNTGNIFNEQNKIKFLKLDERRYSWSIFSMKNLQNFKNMIKHKNWILNHT